MEDSWERAGATEGGESAGRQTVSRDTRKAGGEERVLERKRRGEGGGLDGASLNAT